MIRLFERLKAALLPPPPRVTAETNPWGTGYTVTWGSTRFVSSADGTLWYRGGGGFASWWQEWKCRRAVRRARRLGTIEFMDSGWGELLAELSPDLRRKVVSGGLKGQAAARRSGLLP